MKGKRFTEEHIVAVLREGQAGLGVGELCRKYGISEATYYHWKAKYAGMTVSDLRKLKALEECWPSADTVLGAGNPLECFVG